ncbi:unnamed protein product [Microthlaspi erraticum]|uniref:F-box domain-containing protein n=1 Tax=Microthlaspi erraticum TaxID=1685480 RepID=A0A6D2K492_9BRAS|nr:unnamed protein product [Microthlaspi erraticum]
MNNSVDHHHRKIVRVNTQPSSSRNTIPNDLIIEILLRLTSKSIAICRCVSKQWNSLLGTPYFTESFLIRSSARPRILFTFEVGDKWHICSAPQPQDLDKDLTVVHADYHMGISGKSYYENCLSVHGLICLTGRVPVICNPSTGQHITLSEVKARNKSLRSFLGYDLINKQFKVLCMTVSTYRQQRKSKEHQVLTLGKGEVEWRKTECSFPHYPEDYRDGISICINGVLYYPARSNHTSLIACFDVRSEEFSFVKLEVGVSNIVALVNYKGKLGALAYLYARPGELWVLDDTKNEKWSKHSFVLPHTALQEMKSIWATDTGEIVWVLPHYSKSPFYVFFYNPETKSVRRIEIKGIKEKVLKGQDSHVQVQNFNVTNHVENLIVV